MINPTLKIASITIGVGGIVTGTGVGVYQISQSKQEGKKDKSETTPPNISKTEKKTIATLLTEAKLILLSEVAGDNTIWTNKWEAFKTEDNGKEPTGPWRIEDWNTKKENNEGLTKFKELCGTNSKAQVEDNQDPLYKAVEKHCTKPMTDSSTSLSPAT